MEQLVQKLMQDHRGAGVIEYVILVALAITMIGALKLLYDTMRTQIQNANSQIGGIR